MPSSRPNIIPIVIQVARQFEPQSILDVGIGFGKWGHLFREYTDILAAENDPSRYERKNWRVIIDGIEGHAAYVTEMHRFLYNQIFIGDACQLIRTVANYDLIFLGDMIEHLEKNRGLEFLRQAIQKANKALLLSTPKFDTGQPELCGNELERHRSLWSAKDFHQFPGTIIKTVDRDTLLALMLKPGVTPPVFTATQASHSGETRLFYGAKAELVRLIPPEVPFILIDEDQLRRSLPHRHALPFLEKDGQYWGPPPDDATAIAECLRLRQSGARYLALVSSTFWWLDFYKEFHRYLRSNFRSLLQTEALVIFELQSTST